jgi:TolB-like protein/Flp pilus assembly protein TadD
VARLAFGVWRLVAANAERQTRNAAAPSLHSFVRRLNQLKRPFGPMESKVFISHSNKDKATADMICKQLESAGIKCWIAPRDIDAGSDWTEGIIQGIDSCPVFVLVFSANANGSEHVRREVAKAFSLGLAVIPFRVENAEPHGSLAYFLGTVHWLDAITPPLDKHLDALTERVKQLLVNDGRFSDPAVEASGRRKILSVFRAPSKHIHWITATFLVAAAIAIGFLWLTRRPRNSVSEISAKSIAVLPFENIGSNRDETYFADGVHDEILNDLAKVSQLKVISRTSVMQYRADTKRDLRQIANALGVTNVLEGTVRRDGKHIRVSAQLVDARNDNMIWADSFDRDLTDIFTIQGEVAQTIARKLAATLSPEEKKSIEAKLTDDLEAYDLYLRAKKSIDSATASLFIGNFEMILHEAIDLLKRAVQLDPRFTRAYCEETEAQDLIYTGYDPVPTRRALADEAIESALHLQPDLPEVHLTYAYHLYDAYRDYEHAREQLAIARRGLPNNSKVMALEAYMDRREGKLEKATQELNQAINVDPRNAVVIADLAYTLFMARRLDAAGDAFDRAIDVSSDQPMLKVQKALYVTLFKSGNNAALRSALAALPASMAEDQGALSWRLTCALADRDWQQATELVEKMKRGEDDRNFSYSAVPVPVECYFILLARLQGEQPSAKAGFAETREKLDQRVQGSPGNAKLLSNLAVVDALLGRKENAIAEAKRAVEMLPVSKDAIDGPGILMNLAAVYAWTNEPDAAFDQLDILVKLPNGIYYGNLKGDPYWEPLRKDPRFAKLTAELAPRE